MVTLTTAMMMPHFVMALSVPVTVGSVVPRKELRRRNDIVRFLELVSPMNPRRSTSDNNWSYLSSNRIFVVQSFFWAHGRWWKMEGKDWAEQIYRWTRNHNKQWRK